MLLQKTTDGVELSLNDVYEQSEGGHSSAFNQSRFSSTGSILEQRRTGFELDFIQHPPLIPYNLHTDLAIPGSAHRSYRLHKI